MSNDSWGEWRCGSVKARHFGTVTTTWSLYTNDLFIVTLVPFLCDLGHCVHMVIRGKPGMMDGDRPVFPTWADKQRIKNELVGAQRVAVEVFPPQSELVDQADAYHLWVLPVGTALPFGVVEETAT